MAMDGLKIVIDAETVGKTIQQIALEQLRRQAQELFADRWGASIDATGIKEIIRQAVRAAVESPECVHAIREAVLTVVRERKDDIVQLILGGWVKEAMGRMPSAPVAPGAGAV